MRQKLAKDDITSSAEEKKIQNESVLDFKIYLSSHGYGDRASLI